MNAKLPPFDHVFWNLNNIPVTKCTQNQHIDVAIIGGGMAGLAAAQESLKHGKKVALFEKHLCGSGASGKSSGFITPNAELSFTDFSKRFNPQVAHQIWELIIGGMNSIEQNITQNNFSCDFSKQDTFIAATNDRALKTLSIESENLNQFGYNTRMHDEENMQIFLGSQNYSGGMLYPNSFSINPFLYCQELKKKLIDAGVCIFEETPVLAINDHTLQTPHATITADHIIICVDKDLPDLQMLADDVYHAQTFIMMSEPLNDDQIRTIFPTKQLMVWDTHLIYNYFRIAANNRLILGGGDIFSTYATEEKHNYTRISKKLISYFSKQFPELDIQFEYQWPGLIGISKDIAPIAGRDKDFPHMYYVTAATGLPIATALGTYGVQHLFDSRSDMDDYFSPYRKFPVGGIAQKIIGKQLSFMISNVIKQNVP